MATTKERSDTIILHVGGARTARLGHGNLTNFFLKCHAIQQIVDSLSSFDADVLRYAGEFGLLSYSPTGPEAEEMISLTLGGLLWRRW